MINKIQYLSRADPCSDFFTLPVAMAFAMTIKYGNPVSQTQLNYLIYLKLVSNFHPLSLSLSRSLDNQVYTAGISPARDETASYVAWGHSTLVNPWYA